MCKRGFTVIVDMRGSKWDSIKPLLKILQESFPCCIHVALIIKPDNFWQKQRTNFGSSKFEFEVISPMVYKFIYIYFMVLSVLTADHHLENSQIDYALGESEACIRPVVLEGMCFSSCA